MKEFRFPIEGSHVLMFARSLGDENAIYADAEYAAGQEVGARIAPPTFAEAGAHFEPDYNRRPKPGAKWFGSGREPVGASEGVFNTEGGSGFHAEMRFEYHRPMRVGDVLEASQRPGRRWEKEGRRGGKLVFTETVTEYRDANGELVTTSTFVGVSTEKPV